VRTALNVEAGMELLYESRAATESGTGHERAEA